MESEQIEMVPAPRSFQDVQYHELEAMAVIARCLDHEVKSPQGEALAIFHLLIEAGIGFAPAVDYGDKHTAYIRDQIVEDTEPEDKMRWAEQFVEQRTKRGPVPEPERPDDF